MFLAGLISCGPGSSDNAPNLSSGNETDAMLGRETVRERDSPDAVPVASSKTADPGDPPVGLMWMATELDSQDDGTRRRALEPGAIDPLILAYKEKDDQVRARAMELIDQEDEAGEEGEKPSEE